MGEGSVVLEFSPCFIPKAEAMEELESWTCLRMEAMIAGLGNVSSGLLGDGGDGKEIGTGRTSKPGHWLAHLPLTILTLEKKMACQSVISPKLFLF